VWYFHHVHRTIRSRVDCGLGGSIGRRFGCGVGRGLGIGRRVGIGRSVHR